MDFFSEYNMFAKVCPFLNFETHFRAPSAVSLFIGLSKNLIEPVNKKSSQKAFDVNV